MTTYRHTQTAPRWLPLVPFAPLPVILAFTPSNTVIAITLGILAFTSLFLAACFSSLTVEDAGDHLSLRYGPLAIFRKRFAYADMADIVPARSKAIDGWGIHCIPGRGWTYNLWGYECVEMRYKNNTLRIGSDDSANLARFLQHRASEVSASGIRGPDAI